MKELTQIYKETGQQFIDDLFKDYLVVTEKLSGSSFSFEKVGNDIQFFKGNTNKPINLVDRTLMMYYEKPISFIKDRLSQMSTSFPDNWRFCFQYFVNHGPITITYDTLPKNHLVLTHVKVKNENGKISKIIEDPRVIEDYATLLDVTPLLPIFKGYLTSVQKDKIREFLSTPKEDHQEIFQTNSFAKYLIEILNPSLTSTLLQNDLSKPIDSIIFKFYKPGTTQSVSAKMIDPYTLNLMKDKKPVDLRRTPADINEILLLDMLAFIEERGLKKHEVLSSTPDERYIELVSNIFNDYATKRGNELKKIDIEKADFAKGDEFNLNVDIIPNQRTKDILMSDSTLQDIFKIMLGSLRKKRNPEKAGFIMTPTATEDFNKLISKINDIVSAEDTGAFKTFDDYLKIKATNESVMPSLEDSLLEEKVLSYNKFIDLGRVDILTEAKKVSKKAIQDFWKKQYRMIMKSDDMVNVSSRKGDTGEVLRAGFGANDGTAETNINNFLLKSGLKKGTYQIEMLPIGVVSADYNGYKINITKDTSNRLGQDYVPSEFFIITNRFKISKKTGEAAVIKPKDLTPDKMGLPVREYRDSSALLSAVSQFIDKSKHPENDKNCIQESTREVISNSKNSNKFSDFETYANAPTQQLIYDISEDLFEGIDTLSIKNFQNDYGEVLGGFMLFNLLKKYGTALRYPTASNEKLVDFYFDDYSISSKAGKGGTPSGDTILQRIYSSYKEGNLSFDTIEEQDFGNNVIEVWVNPKKLSRSGIYNTVMNLCNVNIPKSNNSAYWYLSAESKLQPENLEQDKVVAFLDKLHEDKDEFMKFIGEFWKRSTMAFKEDKIESAYNAYEGLGRNRIGVVFYPLMVEATKALNAKYDKQLTKYAQMVTDVKQLYLDVVVKKGIFQFKTVPFKTATFLFEQKGSITNPFNANMGIKIIK